jgi:hypothetical protein
MKKHKFLLKETKAQVPTNDLLRLFNKPNEIKRNKSISIQIKSKRKQIGKTMTMFGRGLSYMHA